MAATAAVLSNYCKLVTASKKKNPLTNNSESPRVYAKHSLSNKSACHGARELHSLGTGVSTMEAGGDRWEGETYIISNTVSLKAHSRSDSKEIPSLLGKSLHHCKPCNIMSQCAGCPNIWFNLCRQDTVNMECQQNLSSQVPLSPKLWRWHIPSLRSHTSCLKILSQAVKSTSVSRLPVLVKSS